MAVPSPTGDASGTGREEFDGGSCLVASDCGCGGIDATFSPFPSSSSKEPEGKAPTDSNVGFVERMISAAGASVLSAILVNPLDVAKTRLQAQDAGVQYSSSPYQPNIHSRIASFGSNRIFADMRCCYPSCGHVNAQLICTSECFQYKGTLDVFNKVARQEGLARLWRGTNAGLALAIPTVGIYLPCYDIFRDWIEGFTNQSYPSMTPYAPLVAGSLARSLACVTCYPIELARTHMQAFKVLRKVKPPGIRKTLLEILSPAGSGSNFQKIQSYRALWMGVGSQLARDVPFSAICWTTLEPIRRGLLGLVGKDSNAASVLGANFTAGFVAGTIAAAATCPFDVAKTRRQIEKDPIRALNMTTRKTLVEVVRDQGMKGLFTGVGPRVGRAGPSVGAQLRPATRGQESYPDGNHAGQRIGRDRRGATGARSAGPEVQKILRDPNMNKVLEDMKSNPMAAQKALADPEIRKNLETLIAAGIVQMR